MRIHSPLAAVLAIFAANACAADDPAKLAAALGGPDAVREAEARVALRAAGDASVPALARFCKSDGPFVGKMLAIELLGQIGTGAARDRLLELLRDEKNLALRGQIVTQLGNLRERRALPLIEQWLATIGPNAINDVPGGKEYQPSTCYLRHLEALTAIGDPAAIPMIEQFAKKVPRGVGYGGFLSNFVLQGANEAVATLKERAAFAVAIKRAGLQQQARAVLDHCRNDAVARFRLHEDELVRHTAEGRRILEKLTKHADAAIASGAKGLLEKWDEIGK